MTGADVVVLSGRLDLVPVVRELVEEFLLLPDSWVLRIAPDGVLPDFLRGELDGVPGAAAPPAGEVVVALVDGEPAGTAQIRRVDDATCELKRMYVRAAYRRCDIGTEMIRSLVGVARSCGYGRMYLDVTPNRPGAIAFYESLDFVTTDPLHDYGLESIAMVREIGPE